LAQAWPLLSARLECNVLATVTMNVLEGRHPGAIFALGTAEGGRVTAAAMRTPPLPLIVSEIDPGQAPALVALWLGEDPEVPGVNGPPATAQAIAAAWSRRTGGTTGCQTRLSIHALDEVHDPPRPAAGQLRVAVAEDRPLLLEWWRAFERDAGLAPRDDTAGVDSRLDHGGLVMWVDGEPVSMVGVTRPVAGVVRIGPVYTPRALRARGYAGTAVAELSRRALAGGARRCMLYTDVANPTSNKIYFEVGYRRLGGWEEHEFRRP
jgi:RimJ/RimL family protein N-acetyltransferase